VGIQQDKTTGMYVVVRTNIATLAGSRQGITPINQEKKNQTKEESKKK
jgi:hypothetical protein